eukprot:13805445-Alexandrium_andersonii.AAC.1
MSSVARELCSFATRSLIMNLSGLGLEAFQSLRKWALDVGVSSTFFALPGHEGDLGAPATQGGAALELRAAQHAVLQA